VGTHFQAFSTKYCESAVRSAAIIGALSIAKTCCEQRLASTERAIREGYLFQSADGKYIVPPLLIRWWRSLQDQHVDEAAVLLQAADEIIALSDDSSPAEHGRKFERQLSHLWRILSVTDSISRREAAQKKERKPRTVLGLLGFGAVQTAALAVSWSQRPAILASFNLPLREPDLIQLGKKIHMLPKPEGKVTDAPDDFEAGVMYQPVDDQNPGWDIAFFECLEGGTGYLLVLLEARFSAETSTTEINQQEIVDKFYKALQGRRNVQDYFCKGLLCYIVGGLRHVQAKVLEDRETLLEAISKQIQGLIQHTEKTNLIELVSGSLVLLTRQHVQALFTPSLSRLPPFSELHFNELEA